MIRFDTVTKRYAGGRAALSELSFEIGSNELVFVSGHSGAGKSTLLKLVALVERPTRGQVLFDGRNIGRVRGRGIARHRRRVGMVFQDHRLLADHSAFDNVALPLVIAGTPRAERERRARAALDKVGLLDRERAVPGELSSGEQQRVGIARAIVGTPPVVVADEPTGNLDPDTSWEIVELLSDLNMRGTTITVATHSRDLVDSLRKRTIVLRNGSVVRDDERGGYSL